MLSPPMRLLSFTLWYRVVQELFDRKALRHSNSDLCLFPVRVHKVMQTQIGIWSDQLCLKAILLSDSSCTMTDWEIADDGTCKRAGQEDTLQTSETCRCTHMQGLSRNVDQIGSMNHAEDISDII